MNRWNIHFTSILIQVNVRHKLQWVDPTAPCWVWVWRYFFCCLTWTSWGERAFLDRCRILRSVVSSLVWYHVTVSAASVGGNPYVNFSIAASSEYPVKAINVVLIKFCRRRRAVATSFLLVAALLVALVLVPEGRCHCVSYPGSLGAYVAVDLL